jgi:hypothetical protein
MTARPEGDCVLPGQQAPQALRPVEESSTSRIPSVLRCPRVPRPESLLGLAVLPARRRTPLWKNDVACGSPKIAHRNVSLGLGSPMLDWRKAGWGHKLKGESRLDATPLARPTRTGVSHLAAHVVFVFPGTNLSSGPRLSQFAVPFPTCPGVQGGILFHRTVSPLWKRLAPFKPEPGLGAQSQGMGFPQSFRLQAPPARPLVPQAN